MTDLHPIFADVLGLAAGSRRKERLIRQGPNVVATDGRIMVWCESDMAVAPNKFAPKKPLDVLNDCEWESESVRLPKAAVKERKVDCGNCGGSGGCDCVNCDVRHKCGACDGIGKLSESNANDIVRVRKKAFAVKYIAILRKHGVTEIFPPRTPIVARLWRFSIGNVSGVVMPM